MSVWQQVASLRAVDKNVPAMWQNQFSPFLSFFLSLHFIRWTLTADRDRYLCVIYKDQPRVCLKEAFPTDLAQYP